MRDWFARDDDRLLLALAGIWRPCTGERERERSGARGDGWRFFEFRRQLDYKARLYGSQVVVANRWYPSSKTCSCCGVVRQTLALVAEDIRLRRL